MGWLLVTAQFVLLALVVLLPASTGWSVPDALDRVAQVVQVAAIVIMVTAATNLGRGLSASPLPNAHAQLRTGGLYRWVRHPIYFGLLLFAVAWTANSGSGWVAGACLALVVLLNVKARWEEVRLTKVFPEYAAYATRTPRILPRLRLVRKQSISG